MHIYHVLHKTQLLCVGEVIYRLKDGNNFKCAYGRLFRNLLHLENGQIIHNVTHLEINVDFSAPFVKGALPDSLTHLTLGDYFDQPLVDMNGKGILPPSLTHLRFGYFYDKPPCHWL